MSPGRSLHAQAIPKCVCTPKCGSSKSSGVALNMHHASLVLWVSAYTIGNAYPGFGAALGSSALLPGTQMGTNGQHQLLSDGPACSRDYADTAPGGSMLKASLVPPASNLSF